MLSNRLVAVLVTIAIAFFGVVSLSPPASAATVNASLTPSQPAIGWNAQPLTFSMTTQTDVTVFAVPGGGAFLINTNYSFSIPSATGVTFTVTKPDTTVMSFPNASFVAASDGFAIEFNEQNVVIPAGSTLAVNFPANTVYFTSAAAKYQMRIYTYMYTFVDSSPWYTVFNSVTFHSNYAPDATYLQGGLGSSALSYPYTRSGYVLQGWSTSAGGSVTYSPTATFDFSAAVNTDLYAVWAVAPMQTVTFDANDGSGTPATTTQTRNVTTALTSNAFTRTGFTFAGWATARNGSGTQYANNANYSFVSSQTLYAKWTALSNTVTYDTHGGSAVTAGSFLSGGTIATLPAAPTKSGYSFTGWFAAASGGSALSNGYAPGVVTAITLHAQWSALSRTVTFDANGGAGSMSSQTSGSSAVLTTNTITRNGYGFTGWNTAANGSGTSYAVGATHPFTSSETLYAQWRALPATPVAAVDIQVPVGSAIANAPVDLDVDGLKDQTGYTVTVYSTPQIIDQGTIWSGRLNTTVRIPANLEAGWHRLVIEGTAADGTPWTEENFFKVSPGGMLLATSEVVPAELAMTGSNTQPVFYGAAFLILVGLGFLAANTTLRRRNNKQ